MAVQSGSERRRFNVPAFIRKGEAAASSPAMGAEVGGLTPLSSAPTAGEDRSSSAARGG